MTPKAEIELVGGLSVTVLHAADEVVRMVNGALPRGLVLFTGARHENIWIMVDKIVTVETG